MKRYLICLLAVVMLLSLSACGNRIDPYSVTLAAEDFSAVDETVDERREITFRRLAVCEGDDYDVIINGIMPDNPAGYVLPVRLANNTEITYVTRTEYVYETDEDGNKHITGEKEITEEIGVTYLFKVVSARVNGREMEVAFSNQLDAGDIAYDQIIFDREALKDLGTVTEIELKFEVCILRDREEYPVGEMKALVYPYGDPYAE